ncbi:MAG TPA: response regulator [Tepidisphaeraceae bacterium]|nr:response regulator [Tepidisphaeraceae bacterium]
MPYILVVDDDPDSSKVLCDYLQKRGYVAQGSPNGHEAMESVLRRVPDAMVVDLFMPRMDGVAFLQVIRSYLRLQSVPVLIWTAYGESPLIKRVREYGVDQILLKSKTTFPEIEEAIQVALQTHSPGLGQQTDGPSYFAD